MIFWRFPCRVYSIYDGDSIDLELDLGFGSWRYEKCRFAGIDTPELRGGYDLSKAAAKFARDEVKRLVAEGESAGDDIIFFYSNWRGKFGRPLGDLEIGGKSVIKYLLANRLGVPYDGQNKKEIQHLHEANFSFLYDAGKLTQYLEED